jgi:epoxyqueuosine reductase
VTDVQAAIAIQALEIGFDAVGVAPADGVADAGARLQEFLDLGRNGDMGWMANKLDRRKGPQVLWPEAKSVIVVGMNYGPEADPLEALDDTSAGAISIYAQGRDYHDVVKKRLKRLARWMIDNFGGDVKVFVDTAPVMEKPLAAAAGLGWQGKHTNMVSRTHGSWLFIGSVFTTLDVPANKPAADGCGSCRACLNVCPTQAFPAPYQLDARRCISYLTIEHQGHIPKELRPGIGNRVFGCDDCLAVCPWNKFARQATEVAFLPRAELTAPRLAELSRLDDTAFRAFFPASNIKRTGRDRFVRNVLIAIGNSGNPELAARARDRLDDVSPLVRAMAVWALSQLLDEPAFRRLREDYLPDEFDLAVREEWDNGC